MSPYYPYDTVQDKRKVHHTYSVFAGLVHEAVQCTGISNPESMGALDGPQRRFTLDRTLQTAAAFMKSLEGQPRTQPYYNVPCDPECQCGRPHRMMNTLLVSADGACRGNGMPGARASVGVFFRHGSPYNEAKVLSGANPTNQRAELYAGITALQIVGDLLYALEGLKDLELVVLKTDSEYLVKGITEWIYNWRVNDWSTADGSPVVNADLFKRLDVLVAAYKNQHAITVKFLHVPRELNGGADGLANRILDERETAT
ncbi:putative ribonuclease h1 [Diplodia seriata]|uniref:ribonuclease H n=1 Tax=Diplodia seriata TaxID=420778 RepID=A0A0G2G226_9PEZI|nr:putative ribonuclease h1 [Diplodia seriata]